MRPGSPCRCRSRTYSVATALMWASANIRRASARSIDSCGRMEAPRKNGNCSPRSWSAVGAAAPRLTLAPEVDNPALGADPHRNNDFNYSNDPRGRQAPFGCHIRRMNPRDTKLTRLTDVNLHRLIRRGTTYGPPYDPNALSEADDQVPRGAYFLFISAKAMATIEFLQQEWINDGNFIGIGDERDPIIGLQEEGASFHHSKRSGQTTRPRHRNVQRASRRRVLLHAEPIGVAVVSGAWSVTLPCANRTEKEWRTPPHQRRAL